MKLAILYQQSEPPGPCEPKRNRFMHRRSGAPNKKSTQLYAECCRLIRQTVSVACNRCDYELGMVRIEIHAPKNSIFHVAYPLHQKNTDFQAAVCTAS